MYGSASKLTEHFKVSPRTIHRILDEYFEKISDGTVYADLSIKTKLRPKNNFYPDRSEYGVESKLDDEVTTNIIALHNRTNGEISIKQMSKLYFEEFGGTISNTSMHRYLKQIESRTQTSLIKRAHPVIKNDDNGNSSSSSTDDSDSEDSSSSPSNNNSLPADSVNTCTDNLNGSKNSKKRKRALTQHLH